MKAYAKIDGIQGEANEKGHEKWIEIGEFHHGVQLDGFSSVSGRSGHFAGTAGTREFVLSKSLDAASPNLNLWCAQAKPIPEVTVHVLSMKGGDTHVDYEIKLSDAVVSSVNIAGSSSGEPVPQETIAFRFGKISWEYKPRDKKQSANGSMKAQFDFAANK